MDEYGLNQLDITRDEIDQLSRAFKNKEFKKLFADYCEEISDPENKKLYEAELTQLEAERGIDITFIHPEPGFVIKTVANGTKKAFINVAKSEKIQPPSSSSGTNANGQPGLNWSLPYSQSPPRNDLDKKGEFCVVYDVVFHPDTLYLAEKNDKFKKLVIDTACDAVKSVYNVGLDLINLRFPKIAYKGQARPTVIRKKNENPPPYEPSPIDQIYPPLNAEVRQAASTKPKAKFSEESTAKPLTKPSKPVEHYTTPKYHIIHRRNVEYHEMTDELDSKINMSIPKELEISINLPLLSSTNSVTLDVTSRKIYLVSETPAKYKLDIELPYDVEEANGTARFDKTARKLILKLPVSKKKHLKLIDINNCREDSGVESDHDSPNQQFVTHFEENSNDKDSVPDSENSELISHTDSVSSSKSPELSPSSSSPSSSCEHSSFLDKTIPYNLPSFACDLMDDTIVVTLQVRNVDSKSIEIEYGNESNNNKVVKIKFASLGAGFFPINYAFAIQFSEECQEITNVDAEAWDNNVILQVKMIHNDITSYLAGLDTNDLNRFKIEKKDETEPAQKCQSIKSESIEEDQMKGDHADLETAKKNENEPSKSSKTKKNKKKNRKVRSLSESNCDDFLKHPLTINEHRKVSAPEPINGVMKQHLKSRSLSESSNDDSMMPKTREIKSILKRRSSYNRSISESSLDEHNGMYHGSIDLSVVGSIPEECGQEMSESVKKTVRFDNKIRKQLYKIRSSIIGQRKPQANKRKKKKHSQERRSSESSDYESQKVSEDTVVTASSSESAEKNKASTSTCGNKIITETTNFLKTMQIDDAAASIKANYTPNNNSDLDFKCDMIFDIEM